MARRINKWFPLMLAGVIAGGWTGTMAQNVEDSAPVFNSEVSVSQTEQQLVSLIKTAFSEGDSYSLMVPSGTQLARIEFPQYSESGEPEHVAVYLDFSKEFVASDSFTPRLLNAVGHQLINLLSDKGISGYFLYIYDEESGEYLEPDDLFPPEPAQKWIQPEDMATIEMAKELGIDIDAPREKTMPVINPGQPQGSLSGKTIYINQSHGWFDDFTWSGNRWRIQRGNVHKMVEDFASPEFINLYVLPALRNAGAKVMTVRESDHQTNMVIVDNADGTSNPSNGTYVETGSWANSSVYGFKQKTTASWNGVSINPFRQGTSANRLCSGVTSGNPTATATWTANIPEDGYYNVYASWAAFSGRAEDAQYRVYHSGGVSDIRVDQTIDGYTWFLLGNWYFEAGAPADERKVVLANNSNDSNAVNVSADAVRWGGGMGDMARHANGISGRPRWEEDSENYLQFNGFGWSGDLYTGDDDEAGSWSDRPQYARWEHSGKDGSVEDALYFAWHTNAANGTARGVTTYRHSTATAASRTLQYIMHDKLYAAANTLWFTDVTWTVRSKNSGNFGENNQSSLGFGLPGFLFEGLFHDTESDAFAYNEPKFRYLYARAIVQGCIDYYNGRDSSSLIYPPEPPINFSVKNLGTGQAQLSWSAGPAGGFNGASATSYRVFRSKNGFGFDDGVVINGTSTTLSGITDLNTTYFRVAAINTGGESNPTETLAVKQGLTPVLLVNGFDRNQRSLIPTETITNTGSGALYRHVPHTFQAFNYVIEHATALEDHPVSISSASNEAVANGSVNLANYQIVIWICGEEATLDDALSSTEQSRLSAYLSGSNKRLMISGAEIGWDLGRSGTSSAADVSFFNNVLRSAYADDDAGTYTVSAASGGPFAGMSNVSFSKGSGARYDAEYPDVYTTIGGSVAALNYSSGGIAGVAYENNDIKVLSLGFPFETIAPASSRQAVMDKVMEFFALEEAPLNDAWLLY